jgi:DNA (cytosine-5)-methyltransferase 1
MKHPQVIDFFCGGGGFSEGFRQQGFQVVMGIDRWLPAIETHNLNHHLDDKPSDVLAIGSSIEKINQLPNTEVIVGSPPCVSFSHSNHGGNADKTEGIKLIEAFLRIVAVKKHQPDSNLAAWFLENVPNSKNHIKDTYTFQELDLEDWAKLHKLNPDAVALNAGSNGQILNTADFGTPQLRKRFFCGEIVSTGKFPDLEPFKVRTHRSLGKITSTMPPPHISPSEKVFADPNYPSLKLPAKEITDHFYDSGIYRRYWVDARWLKLNHPYMGPLSFPENRDKPSRTILATQSASSREALIYKSEHNRKGDGEYRLPTVREVATLMGFPYTYQFAGKEGTKWKLVGNAVSPRLSSALARSVRVSMRLRIIPDSDIPFNSLNGNASAIINLNSFTTKLFNDPPKKHPKARFRRHPFKDGNMTVALTNFDPTLPSGELNKRTIEWFTAVFFGTGEGFKRTIIRANEFKRIGKLIESQYGDQGRRFIQGFEKRFRNIIGKRHLLQKAYVGDNLDDAHDPRHIIDDIGQFISSHKLKDVFMALPDLLPEKKQIPIRQVLAIYAINRIIS